MNDLFLVVCALSAVFFLSFCCNARGRSTSDRSGFPRFAKPPAPAPIPSAGAGSWPTWKRRWRNFSASTGGRRRCGPQLRCSHRLPCQCALQPSRRQLRRRRCRKSGDPARDCQRTGPDEAEDCATGGGIEAAPSSEYAVGRSAGGDHAVAETQPDVHLPAESALSTPAADTKKKKPDPFSFADFTWLNGNTRTKEVRSTRKFFTPEIRADVDYIYDFNHPKDDTIGGSSEIFRSNEVPGHAARRGRRLPLRQRAGPADDAVRHVFHRPRRATMPARRAASGTSTTPIATSPKPTAAITSTRWTASTSRPASSCRTSACSATTTSTTGPISRRMCPRTRRGSSTACACRFSQRAPEDRALVHQRLAVLWPVQQPARRRRADSVAAEWLVLVRRQSVRAGRGCAGNPGPRALSHRRQHPGEVLPQSVSASWTRRRSRLPATWDASTAAA